MKRREFLKLSATLTGAAMAHLPARRLDACQGGGEMESGFQPGDHA